MPKTKQAVEQAAKLKLYIPQLDEFEGRLLEWIEQDKYQACMIKVMRYGISIFEGCYGTSTNESGVYLDTISPVFSSTKPVVATLIFKLLEQGRLELGDLVSKFLPDYTGGGKENTNLVHLLTHTHGFDGDFDKAVDKYIKEEFKIETPQDGWEDKNWEKYNSELKKALELPEDCTNREVWTTVRNRVDLVNQPGKVMAYSNYGYDILRDIICAVTGGSIDEFAQKVLFEPVGMIDSHWTLPKEKYGRVLGRNEKCTGHGWINSENCYNNQGGGNGLKTTVCDMSRFCEMILNEGKYNNQRIISPASIKQMGSNYNSSLPNSWDSWGLGWNYRGTKVDDAGVLRSSNSVEHGGWAGYKLLVDREYGLTAVCSVGEYDNGSFPGWGRIHNMIIAAFE
ncbi:MAG: beta-lactamase family protein [Oscillospiraceae bacterium]|nr:beta-lactamase family protein [Oscillospiraceae bacterium]